MILGYANQVKLKSRSKMSIYHDEIEIEDMEYDDETEIYHYPCPCGDRFEITLVWKIWWIYTWTTDLSSLISLTDGMKQNDRKWMNAAYIFKTVKV